MAACGERQIDSTYAQDPIVTALSPSSGPSIGGTTISIQGRVLCSNPRVTFGDQDALSLKVASSELLLAVSPPHPRGEVPVTVWCNAEQVPGAMPFRFHATDVRFQTAAKLPEDAQSESSRLMFGDVNGDGLDDLFVLAELAGFKLSFEVFLNTGANGFEESPHVA
jgi:hypothetical protein